MPDQDSLDNQIIPQENHSLVLHEEYKTNVLKEKIVDSVFSLTVVKSVRSLTVVKKYKVGEYELNEPSYLFLLNLYQEYFQVIDFKDFSLQIKFESFLNAFINPACIENSDLVVFEFGIEMDKVMDKLLPQVSEYFTKDRHDYFGTNINLGILDLDFTRISQLKTIVVVNNNFTIDYANIRLSDLQNLEDLRLGSTNLNKLELKELDLSGLINLKALSLDCLSINKLNLSALVSLEFLFLARLHIHELDLSGLVNLKSLNLNLVEITELDLSGLVNLSFLMLRELEIKQLDISNLVNLDFDKLLLALFDFDPAILSMYLPNTTLKCNSKQAKKIINSDKFKAKEIIVVD
jgi:hypothetical protein